MPQLGHFRKSPIMLGERLHKAKNEARPYNMSGAEHGGYLTQKPNQNGRNIPYDALKKLLGRLSKKGLEVAEKAGEKAIEKVADKALEKVLGKN